ncbi:MAG: hypothetical protein Q7U47_11905 [Paludibacter sp.]|nr:hypothetical protein [Paludibacter sp.]
MPECGGTDRFSFTIGNNTGFNGIYISTPATAMARSYVYGNKIKNIYLFASSPIAQVYKSAGISVNGGKVRVGIMEDETTAAGNIIGDLSASTVGITNASIIFTGSGANASFAGITFNSLAGADVKIENNKIAGICVNSYATARTSSLIGIDIIGTAASTAIIDNNEIGNGAVGVAPTAMSIQNYQGRACFGIYMNSAGAASSSLTISNNKINNMYKPQESITPATNTPTYVYGIWFNTAVLCPVTITNNEIRDLVFTAGRVNDTPIKWSSGITFGSQAAGSVIRNNSIYNIQGIGAFSYNIMGVCLVNTASAARIDVNNNLIYNLSSNVTRQLGANATGCTGIFTNTSGALVPGYNVYNNMIRLGYDRAGNELSTANSFMGIRDSMMTTGAANVTYYNNTVYLGGSGVVHSDTIPTFGMCFATSATNAVVRNVRNNLIVNDRSNATTGAKHYAIGTGGSASALTNFTSDFNNYVTSGTGGILGRFTSKEDAINMTNLQTFTAGDVNSKNAVPVFISATSPTPDLHLNQTNTQNSNLNFATNIALTNNDFDGDARKGTDRTFGADEYTGPLSTFNASSNQKITVSTLSNQAIVKGAKAGSLISFYSIGGQLVQQLVASEGITTTKLKSGIYILQVESKTWKLIL